MSRLGRGINGVLGSRDEIKMRASQQAIGSILPYSFLLHGVLKLKFVNLDMCCSQCGIYNYFNLGFPN